MFDCALSLAIRLGSAAVVVGWLLSACGELNGRGYLFLGVPMGVAVALFTGREGGRRVSGETARRLKLWLKRRRWLPLIYFLTLGLIIAGSIPHEPNNFDGLSYREPKVLYWLIEQRWHWIASPYEVINYTLPNYEWLTVPFFLLTRGFHSTVVINWLSFLFLPSLMFTLLRSFGARGRTAFDWMWIFPSGYIIVMEAGGIGNDITGLVTLLAALHCANRFVARGKSSYLFDALLAAGFCTGVKLSNVPLPGFVLILLLREPARLPARRTALTAGLIIGLAVSALIPVINNFRQAGTIFGSTTKLDQVDSPIAGWVGNGLITLVSAFEPPVFPGAKTIMPAVERGLGPGLLAWLHLHYDKFSLRLHELPQEEIGGLGIGITAALLISAGLWLRVGRSAVAVVPGRGLLRWQRLAWWSWFILAALVIASKLGTGLPFPRNMLPWSPVALAPLAAFFGRAPSGRSLLWRIGAPLAALSVWPAIFLNPARPLLPAETMLNIAEKLHAPAGLEERMRVTYEVYGKRADAFAELVQELPPETRVLGLVTHGSEPTVSFWKPYFSRRCVYLTTDADLKSAPGKGVEYFVVSEDSCMRYFNIHTDELLARFGARAVKSVDVRMLAGRPAERYTLARFERK